MSQNNVVEYPAGAIKLHRFLGPSIRVLVDGRQFENNRLDVIFPNESELKAAIGKLVRVATGSREDALRFILGVMDEYSQAATAAAVDPDPVKIEKIG